MKYGFGRFPNFYLGVEEEYQIFDKGSYKPVSSKYIINKLKKQNPGLCYKDELLINAIEVNTKPEKDICKISENLEQIRGTIIDQSEENNVYCIGIGVYPYIKKVDLCINVPYAKKRAQTFLDYRIREGKDYAFNACHIHASIDNYKNALSFLDCASALSPILLAVSASSPAFAGEPTGYMSYRRKVWERIGAAQKEIKIELCQDKKILKEFSITNNVPPNNLKERDWDSLYSNGIMLGSWLTRVDHLEDKGTVQFRTFDAVGSRDIALGLASLCQGLEYCFLEGKIDYKKCLEFSNEIDISLAYTEALRNRKIKNAVRSLITYVEENSDITIKEDMLPIKKILNKGNISEEILSCLGEKKKLTERFSLNGGMGC